MSGAVGQTMGSIPADLPLKHIGRSEALKAPSPLPRSSGVYAWYLRDVPSVVPTDACLVVDGHTLLYVGIAPDGLNKPNSRASLFTRIRQHYRGNAEGSTLRRTLGVLLAARSGFPLRRVGSGQRMTLTHAGERYLDDWMDQNARVAWIELAQPWHVERTLLSEVSCPLNIRDNEHHRFQPTLRALRSAALRQARLMATKDGLMLRWFKQLAMRGCARELDGNGVAKAMRLCFSTAEFRLMVDHWERMFPASPMPKTVVIDEEDTQTDTAKRPRRRKSVGEDLLKFLAGCEKNEVSSSDISGATGIELKSAMRTLKDDHGFLETCESLGWTFVNARGRGMKAKFTRRT